MLGLMDSVVHKMSKNWKGSLWMYLAVWKIVDIWLPLWSGIILRTVNSDGNVTESSNVIVENWFRIVKHSIFTSETGIQLLFN